MMEPTQRVTRSKEEARATYTRLSRWFDLIFGVFENKFRRRALALLNAHTGERILEIGFGSGHGIVSLARSVGDTGKIYGIDLSEGMLGVTAGRVKQAGLTGRVELCQGDAARLPYDEGIFDAVFMSYVLELFDTPEIPVVLEECRRVLKPGGRICILALSRQGRPRLMRRLYNWCRRWFPNILDCRPIFVEQALRDAQFQIDEARRVAMLGLPMEIVLASLNRKGKFADG